MTVISPAVLAYDGEEYARQINRISSFAKRIQIDLMDGEFVDKKSIDIEDVWWPEGVEADVHLMFSRPDKYFDELSKMKPNLVIIHAEAPVNHMYFAAKMHLEGIKAGLAVLPDTTIESVEQVLHSFDHLMIFGGELGRFGGKADLSLLDKAREAKAHHPEVEIGWDGGVNDQNVQQIADAGVDVLNVGGYIQKSDDPEQAYLKLQSYLGD